MLSQANAQGRGVKRLPVPNTQNSLHRELSDLGLRSGMTVMVHSSLGQLGWTVGGPVTVVRALVDVLGPKGTLVMPAESPYTSDPSTWNDPRVPPEWYETIRESLPVFDPQTTPTTMGAIAEAFRTFPGTRRSIHPLVSVCANGLHAEEITQHHRLEFCEGKGTPFEALYNLEAHTLLLGVGFDRCTSLHYAESLVPNRRTTLSRYPILQGDERLWVQVPDMAPDHGAHFPLVGRRFRESHQVMASRVGNAEALLFSTRALVDFAQSYFLQALTS